METRNRYSLLLGKPGGKRPPGNPRHIWLDGINEDLVEIGLGDAYWIGVAQDR
jgi:hypothetical protein